MIAVANELEPTESARRFYCGLLNGRQLAANRFLIGDVIIETDRTDRITLRVNDPEGVAARCWNAGYTVVVDDTPGTAMSVLDPFGVRIDLARA